MLMQCCRLNRLYANASKLIKHFGTLEYNYESYVILGE